MSSVAVDPYTGLRELRASLPATAYVDGQIHAREMEAIWRRSWVHVARASDIPLPRDFRVVDVGGIEVILLRGDDDVLRGFRNTCRHRGSALCAQESGRLKGPLLVCPYHAWSYRQDGRLAGIPSKALPSGFDREAHGLSPAAVEVWRGLVFVNLQSDPGDDVLGSFDPASGNLSNWPLEELVVGHAYRKTMACNWKVFWENFNECLHCPGVHRDLSALVPIYGRGYMTRHDDPDWIAHEGDEAPEYSGRLREGAESWSADGRIHALPFAGLTPAERAVGQTYMTHLPSMFVVGHADYVRTVRLLPLGPERTELVAEWLFEPDALPLSQTALDAIVGFARQVLDEDAAACELNQRGLRSAGNASGILMPEEYDVARFQDWVRSRLAAPGAP